VHVLAVLTSLRSIEHFTSGTQLLEGVKILAATKFGEDQTNNLTSESIMNACIEEFQATTTRT
jgi:hypothetical protein